MYTTFALSKLITSQGGTLEFTEKNSRKNKFMKRKESAKRQKDKDQKKNSKGPSIKQVWKKKAEMKRIIEDAESQSGETDFINSINEIIKEWDLPEGITNIFLKVLCYYRSVRKSVDWEQFVSTTGLFLLSLCDNETNFREVIGHVLFGKSVDLNALTVSDMPTSQSGIAFCESLDMLRNFKLLRDNELTRRIVQVIATAFSCGLVRGKKDLYFTSFNLSFILEQFTRESNTVFDFFDSLLNIFQFIVEKGYTCFQQRTFAPLFMSDEQTADYDKDLAEVLGYWPAIQAGNYKDTPFCSVPHFANALDNLYTATTALVEQSTDTFSKRYHAKNLEKLNTIAAKFKSQERSGGLREAPFAFCIYGKSSIGKSSVMATLTDYCLKAIAYLKNPKRVSFEVDPRMICSQNANDKYDSDYKSYTLAVLFDDLANERIDVARQSPLDPVIRYINNIKSTALKADVHEKGVIQKEPWLIGASTNIKNLQADQFSIEPISILRRFNIHIEPHVAPNYQKEDGIFLDGRKLAEADQSVPDAWRFNAYHYEYDDKLYKQNSTQVTRAYTSVPFKFEGGDGKEYVSTDLDMEQLQWLMYKLLKDHFKSQHSVIVSNKKINEEQLCQHILHTSICSICSPDHVKPTPRCIPVPLVKSCTPVPPAKSRTATGRLPTIEQMNDEEIFMGRMVVPGSSLRHYRASKSRTKRDADHVTDATSESGFTGNWKRNIFLWYKWQFYFIFVQWSIAFIYGFVRELWRLGWFKPSTYDRVENARWRVKYYADATAFYARNWMNNVTDTIDEINSLRFVSWKLIDFIPDSWVEDTRFAWIYMFKYDLAYYPQLILSALIFWLFSVWITFKIRGQNMFWRNFFAILGYVYIALLLRKKFLMKELRTRRGALRGILKYSMKMMIGTSIQVMLTFGGIAVSYKLVRAVLKTIGIIGRTSHGGAIDIGSEKENVWLNAVPMALPKRDPKTDTLPADQVSNIVLKNTTACIYDNKTWSSGFFPRSQILLVPTHEVANKEKINLQLRKDDIRNLSGGNINVEITPARVYHFPGKDISAVYHSRYPDKQDLTHLFPCEIPQDRNPTKWVTRKQSGAVSLGTARRNGIAHHVSTDKTVFRDSTIVTYKEETCGGDCIKVHVADVRSGSHIVGFHLAGKNYAGYLSTLTKSDLEQCYAHFNAQPTTRLSATMGDMKTQLYDKDFTPQQPRNKKSTINYLTDAEINYYGDLPEYLIRPNSNVIKSPISDSVASHCGVKNKYGKPANCRKDETKIPSQAPYNKYYCGAGKATQEFPLEVLEIAQNDYLDDCISNKKMMADLKTLRPLTEVETISGQDGVKFVDSMKMSTSKGFPLSGSKEEIITHLDPEEYENISDPRIFDGMFMDDWRKARQLYLAGLRAYPIFKACTKDEPTKLSKDKVRVFQSAPLTLQCMIRQYFLPIAACMSRNPVTTECAVGINSQGPQWNKLMRHLSKFGKKRMVAGDFKAYDQHMSSTMTSIAFSTMIELAKHCDGYTTEDIKIMSNLVADVVHPMMCVNGDLVELLGSNPSGQNLTVYINSIVNSLYQRCVFYTIYPPGSLDTTKFQDYVALMTYGDDNEMSVSEKAPLYNHTHMMEVYASQGIEYTMADKDAESVPYITLEEADFLKRATVFRPEYSDPSTREKGMYLAKLSEESIFKSLHCNMLSKVVSKEEIARQCLDGALRELWFYGREHFEMRHEQFKNIVFEHEWQHIISPNFYKTFDEREEEWLEKYNLVRTGIDSQSGTLPYRFNTRIEPSSLESQMISTTMEKLKDHGVVQLAREYTLDGGVTYGDILARYGDRLLCIEFKRKSLEETFQQAQRQAKQVRLLHWQNHMLGITNIHSVAITNKNRKGMEFLPPGLKEVLETCA
jgi:hypothetical protein